MSARNDGKRLGSDRLDALPECDASICYACWRVRGSAVTRSARGQAVSILQWRELKSVQVRSVWSSISQVVSRVEEKTTIDYASLLYQRKRSCLFWSNQLMKMDRPSKVFQGEVNGTVADRAQTVERWPWVSVLLVFRGIAPPASRSSRLELAWQPAHLLRFFSHRQRLTTWDT